MYSLNVLTPSSLREPEDPVLGRPHESAARLDHATGPQVVVEHPAAHPVARLDDEHLGAAGAELPRCGQSGDAGTDHDDVDPLGQRPAVGRGTGRVRPPQPASSTGCSCRTDGEAAEQSSTTESALMSTSRVSGQLSYRANEVHFASLRQTP